MNGPESYNGSQETAAIQGINTDYVSLPINQYPSYQNMETQLNILSGQVPTVTAPTPYTPPVQANSVATLADTTNYGGAGGNNALETTPETSTPPTNPGNNNLNQKPQTPTPETAPANTETLEKLTDDANTNSQPENVPVAAPTDSGTTNPQSAMATGLAAAGNTIAANNGASMKVSIEGIMQSKVKIDASANSLDTLWRAIQAQISAISQSWVGPDATLYVEKLNKMAPKVDAAVNALRKISTTYRTALDEIQENQDKIKSELQ